LALVCFLPANTFSQRDSLRTKIEHILPLAKGKVGVAIIGLENYDTLTFDGNGRFPMQSVYKFPLALAVLDQVDKGRFTLDQKIHITKTDLLPRTWSPLREKYPEGNTDITVRELLTYTVSESDNNGCDILFRLLGGPGVVDRYIHHLGIANIAIVATEEEMHKDWQVQYRNWCSPAAMGQMLRMFYRQEILSRTSTDFLWQTMVKTGTGPRRIKGLLPTGAIVAHKTGSSGTNEDGITAATNDVGVVTLPNDKYVAIVVFVSDSMAEEKVCEDVIAEIAKMVWDAYTVQ